MKKLLGVLIVATTLISSTFALGLSIGGKGIMGGSLGEIQNSVTEKSVSKLAYGGGAFVNFELFGGLGAQAEANFVHSDITGGNYLDIPVMGWWELNFFDVFKIGLGGGVNFSKIVGDVPSAIQSVPDLMNFQKDIAVGANVKIFFNRHFGIVIGANGVFQMKPQEFFGSLFKGDIAAITDTKGGTLRKEIYGSVGLEFKLF